MNERGILMQPESVVGILADRKTQTRRVVRMTDAARRETSGPSAFVEWQGLSGSGTQYHARVCNPDVNGLGGYWATCPYGVPGDRLWVRETFNWSATDELLPKEPRQLCLERAGYRAKYVVWRADGEREHPKWGKARWLSPLFMPKWASRLTLVVKALRLERVQSITEEDAVAEGITRTDGRWWDGAPHKIKGTPRAFPTAHEAYADLWDAINGKRAPWKSNPWVWRVCFEKLKGKRSWLTT